MPKRNRIEVTNVPSSRSKAGRRAPFLISDTRTQRLAESLGSAEWADGSFFTTRDWMGNGTQRDYAEALLSQAQAARENGRPKIAKAYERMARNNGADAGQFKEYRSNIRELGLSVG